MNSRQPSVDRTLGPRPSETPDRTLRAPSTIRGTTPVPMPNNPGVKNGSVMTGNTTKNNPGPLQVPPFEDIILRKRGLGQDIVPSPNQPKRTESLFVPGQTQGAVKVSTDKVSNSRYDTILMKFSFS